MKNKLIFKASIIVLWGLFLIHVSCEKKDRCIGSIVPDSYFSFKLTDKFGVNLIAAWGARYLSDSVYLTKFDGTLPNRLDIGAGGRIGFVIPDDDSEARDSSVTKYFLLSLPDFLGNPGNDIDTLKFRYRFYGSCYDSFQVWYNDSLYHNGNYTDFISFLKK